MKYFLLFFSLFTFLNLNFAAAANSVKQINNSNILSYKISASKLDESRNNLSARTGQSAYSFEKENIDNLPQGQATQLNQVLLRAPGVTQNSFGQFHIRGDHSNVQYRINDVMIPQGISSFADNFDTHFAESIDLLRGALPAQYGFRNAGVVDIKTKGGKFEKQNRSEVMLGGNQTLGYNQQVGGFDGKLNYYLNASYLQNSRGIDSPTSARNSIHNDSSQDRLFGYFSYILDSKKRLSLIMSNANNRFEVPNSGSKLPVYELNNLAIDSNNLNQKQKDSNSYSILALQGVADSGVDYQVSLFTNYSSNVFKADYAGDLIYSGVASDTDKTAFNNGIQGDFSYQLDSKNILRSGFFISDERVKSDKNSAAFLLEEDVPTEEVTNIVDNKKYSTQLYGFYVQDEFKPTEKLTINAGLRFDAISGNVNENQISPRLGATYNITNNTKIFGGYARYFSPARTSNISNINVNKYLGTTAQPEVTQNDQVRPERSNYYDIGINHKVNDNLSFTIDSYYKDSRNLVDEHQFGNALIYSPFNYQRGEAYGVEFGGDYKKDNLSAFFNFSTQKVVAKNIISSQFITHEEDIEASNGRYIHLDHDQTYSASFGASYLFKQTTYALDGFYGSGLRTSEGNANTMPSYIQTNISAARNFDLAVIGKTNIRLSMINIFDNIYQLRNGSGVGIKASQYGPRRTAYLILSKQF